MIDYKEILLNDLDKANLLLQENDMKLELVVVGSAALVLKNLVERKVEVIDSLLPVNEITREWIKDIVKINSEVTAFDSTFGSWKKDVEDLIKFSNIKIKSLSDERLIASRVFETIHRQDVLVAAVKCKMDQEKFEEVFLDIRKTIDPVMDFLHENKKLMEEVYKLQGWNFKKSELYEIFRDKNDALD